ncbi:MAG: hypothetical protein ACR652_00890 [Methylocystis sp.]|uniref:hypothetical protein n=1 Tax=Methylocystis sp. TaxID=1911079 RepID=UPI003DA57890
MSSENIERHLKAAERHIAVGEMCIDRQRAVIASLECHEDHKELLAEAARLLAQFHQIQALHLADRDRLVGELNKSVTCGASGMGQF